MSNHKWYKCDRECEGCIYCNGGLAYCTVCKAGEVELTAECPGRVTTDEERKQVAAGRLDFRGHWGIPVDLRDMGKK